MGRLSPGPNTGPTPPQLVLLLGFFAAMQGEQEEYAREGIAWSYIDFVDNQDCLDL